MTISQWQGNLTHGGSSTGMVTPLMSIQGSAVTIMMELYPRKSCQVPDTNPHFE
jgi:hypothetical protein